MGMSGGLFDRAMGVLFGGGGTAVRETVEVFRENAEGRARREADARSAVLEQFAAEFARSDRGLFDRLVDAANRLPRPAMALGTLGLFAAAMTDPVWFGERMRGLSLVPEPMWWLLGAVVSFYFGARHQVKSQQFQRSLAETALRAEGILSATAEPEGDPRVAEADPDAAMPAGGSTAAAGGRGRWRENRALDDWRRGLDV